MNMWPKGRVTVQNGPVVPTVKQTTLEDEIRLFLADTLEAEKRYESAASRLSKIVHFLTSQARLAERLRTTFADALAEHGVTAMEEEMHQAVVKEYTGDRKEVTSE